MFQSCVTFRKSQPAPQTVGLELGWEISSQAKPGGASELGLKLDYQAFFSSKFRQLTTLSRPHRTSRAVDPLYTELGIWPISERRLLLVLVYLDYLLGAEDSLLAKRAVFESYELWTHIRAPCWIGDFNQRVIRYTERSRLLLPLILSHLSNLIGTSNVEPV
jgi:hypothetical protein